MTRRTITFGLTGGRIVTPSTTAMRAKDQTGAATRTTLVHLANEGEFKGYGEGKTFDFNAARFAEVQRNCVRLGRPVKFTYEHPSGEVYKRGLPVPSSGSVHEMRVIRCAEHGGRLELWGLTTFTPAAAEYIKADEYSYCSIVFTMDYMDPRTGEPCGMHVAEVGLTDSPFMPDQHAIVL